MKWCIDSKIKEKPQIGDTREVQKYAWTPKQITYQNLPYKIWLEYYMVTEVYREGGDGGSTYYWHELPLTRHISYY